MAAIVVSGLIMLGTAAPALAGTLEHSAMPVAVCNQQGHFGASTLNPFDAYASYCYDLGFGLPVGVGFTPAGPLDVQGYCNAKYPGSKAVVVENNTFGWRCRTTF
jgi:hypothetical protein